jgi:hypothetical protein
MTAERRAVYPSQRLDVAQQQIGLVLGDEPRCAPEHDVMIAAVSGISRHQRHDHILGRLSFRRLRELETELLTGHKGIFGFHPERPAAGAAHQRDRVERPQAPLPFRHMLRESLRIVRPGAAPLPAQIIQQQRWSVRRQALPQSGKVLRIESVFAGNRSDRRCALPQRVACGNQC